MFSFKKIFSSWTKANEDNKANDQEDGVQPITPWLKYHACVLPKDQAELLSSDGTFIAPRLVLAKSPGRHDKRSLSTSFSSKQSDQSDSDRTVSIKSYQSARDTQENDCNLLKVINIRKAISKTIPESGNNDDYKIPDQTITRQISDEQKLPTIYLQPVIDGDEDKKKPSTSWDAFWEFDSPYSMTYRDYPLYNDSDNLSQINGLIPGKFVWSENDENALLTNRHEIKTPGYKDENYLPSPFIPCCDLNNEPNFEFHESSEIIELQKTLIGDILKNKYQKVEVNEDREISNGLGLISTQKITAGEIVMIEEELIKCLTSNESLWKQFLKLDNYQKKIIQNLEAREKSMTRKEIQECFDICANSMSYELFNDFLRFVVVMKCNGHGTPERPDEWALYAKGTRCNHSCSPNVSYRNLNGKLVYLAIRDIEVGESITMAYTNELFADSEYRGEKLLRSKFFVCECKRCRDTPDICRQVICPKCPLIESNELQGNPKSFCVLDLEKKDQSINLLDYKETTTILDDHSALDHENAKKSDDPFVSDDVVSSDMGDDDTLLMSSSMETISEKLTSKILSGKQTVSSDDIETLTGASSENFVIDKLPLHESSENFSLEREDTKIMTSTVTEINKQKFSFNSEKKIFTLVRPKCCLPVERNLWQCCTCENEIPNDSFTIKLEDYLRKQWKILSSCLEESFDYQLKAECDKMLGCIVKYLGKEHWLYAGIHYLISNFYMGLYPGGIASTENFNSAVFHGNIFLNFIEEKVPGAIHIDAVPHASNLMRLSLFYGRCDVFRNLVERGFLDRIKTSYGYWDETYLSYKKAYDHIIGNDDEHISLSHLHLLAYNSQLTSMRNAEKLQEEMKYKENENQSSNFSTVQMSEKTYRNPRVSQSTILPRSNIIQKSYSIDTSRQPLHHEFLGYDGSFKRNYDFHAMPSFHQNPHFNIPSIPEKNNHFKI